MAKKRPLLASHGLHQENLALVALKANEMNAWLENLNFSSALSQFSRFCIRKATIFEGYLKLNFRVKIMPKLNWKVTSTLKKRKMSILHSLFKS